MLLVVHVGVALASVVYTAYVFFFPSNTKLTITYYFIVATLVTGISLVISNLNFLPHVCIVGIAYILVSFSLVALIRTKIKRLAAIG